MKPSRPSNRHLMRAMNRNLVLNLIQSAGPLSRTDIARRSGLGNATVSEITGELVTSGLVEEVGEGESTGGRRPLFLRLNPEAGYVVGVKVMERSLTCAITDLNANVIAHHLTPLGNDHRLTVIQNVLIKAIESAVDNAKIGYKRVIGIGIGLAGLIDPQQGLIRYSPFFEWRNVNFAEALEAHFDLPVYLENDVNTLTIAEQWFGHGRDVDHFAVVTVGRGIGSGIVTNGQFCRDAAGEIGHTTLLLDGPRCDCGKQGCLEAVAADPAVVREVKQRLSLGAESSLRSVGSLSFDTIITAADAGDSLAIDSLARSGYCLGIGIANLINILSPQLVIVSGEGIRAGAHRLEPMRRAIDEHVFNGLGEQVRIVTEWVGDETWARGAASLVLGEIFKSPVLGDSKVIERLLPKPV